MSARMAMIGTALSLVACGSSNGSSTGAETAQLPAEAELCKIGLGYEAGSASGVKMTVLGTHIDDARAVLGEPEQHTDSELTYKWCVGTGCTKTVTATLTFTKIDRCYHDNGKPITPPYWLTSAKTDGFALPDCWHVGSEKADRCPECLAAKDIAMCPGQ